MKYNVYTCLLLLGIGLSVSADSIAIGGGYRLVGKVGVGDNRGTPCSLALSDSTAAIYGNSQIGRFSQYKRSQNKWAPVSESFGMQDYNNGQLFGSKQKSDHKGAGKKLTITLFKDQRTQMFKAIVHESNLVSDGSVGKFIVCENMVVK